MVFSRFVLFLSVVFILFAQARPACAQDFEEGLQLYEQQEYEKALSIFNRITNTEGYLFTGKSLYAMGRYRQAQSNLNNIPDDAPKSIYFENIYTSALIDFQIKEFGNALNKLYRVINSDTEASLRLDAKQIYRQLLNYLTAEQRLSALSIAESDELKFDLMETALGKVTYEEAQEILDASKSELEEDEWIEKAEDIETKISSAQNYRRSLSNSGNILRAPDGTIYNIGIALPAYKPKDQEFAIVRSLYYGTLLAAENFNQNNRNAKIATHFIDTEASTEGLRSIIQQFLDDKRGDALIGPLFSEQAEAMIPITTELKIPAIAPLANSQINSDNSYLFQSNPTFGMHGKEMARYAVRELQMERFAVLAQRGSSGASSAEAFIDEAENLGAEITYTFVEDLQANEYEISQYSRYFGSKEDPIDAVYAPFTGPTALTLIDLLLVDLKAMNNPPVVLGSQEWQKLNFSSTKYNRLDIHFSEGYYLSSENSRLSRFKNNYRNKFGSEPDQFAMIGYDISSFVFNSLDNAVNPALLEPAIRNHPLYQGLVNDIQFNGKNINRAVKIFEVTKSGELITK